MTTTLEAARTELGQRLVRADARDDWATRRWLAPLADVADMVCRIGDHDDSKHYQADKATNLVQSALRVRRACLERYADLDDPNERPKIEKALHDLTEIADRVETAISGAMWSLARLAQEGTDGAIYQSDAANLADVARDLGRLAERLATTARPDPED